MLAAPRIFGSEGCLLYSGNDADPASGKLELLLDNGSVLVEDRAASWVLGGFEDCICLLTRLLSSMLFYFLSSWVPSILQLT